MTPFAYVVSFFFCATYCFLFKSMKNIEIGSPNYQTNLVSFYVLGTILLVFGSEEGPWQQSNTSKKIVYIM